MPFNRLETRWGDTLQYETVNSTVVRFAKRCVQAEVYHGRTWGLRYYAILSRPLVVGETLNLEWTVSEGLGSGAAVWSIPAAMVSGDRIVGPLGVQISASELVVDSVVVSGVILTNLQLTMQAWAAPVTPVLPSDHKGPDNG